MGSSLAPGPRPGLPSAYAGGGDWLEARADSTAVGCQATSPELYSATLREGVPKPVAETSLSLVLRHSPTVAHYPQEQLGFLAPVWALLPLIHRPAVIVWH